LYSEREFSVVVSSSMAAKADFEEIPEIPAHSIKPINFRLLKPAFGDIKGKLRMDMFTPLNVSFFFVG
jgi:hypothetical protein